MRESLTRKEEYVTETCDDHRLCGKSTDAARRITELGRYVRITYFALPK